MYICNVCDGTKCIAGFDCRNCGGTGKVDWIRNVVRKVNINYVLRWACINGNLQKVKFLIKQGADIHSNNNEALQWSVNNKHLDVVKFLVEHGANTHNLTFPWGINPKFPEIVEYLKLVESKKR